MSDQGRHCPSDALADNVLQNIFNREALIERLEKVHQHQSTNQPSRQNRIQRLLYGIHNASLSVVEATEAWNRSKQDDWYRRKNIESHASYSMSDESPVGSLNDAHISCSDVPCPPNVFFWNGQNYLQKMLADLDFVGDIIEAIACLGSNTSFHRNPFLLPLGVDELCGPVSPQIRSNTWSDVNIQRVRRAAFVILLYEYYRKESSFKSQSRLHELDFYGLRRDAINSAKFRPPKLDMVDLTLYTEMDDPPATIAVAICSAHLVLESVGADITDKLIYLTKDIVLKIFHQPLKMLIHKARVHNPLRHPEGYMHIIKIIHPFVMHQRMDPDFIVGVPDQILLLITWLRAFVKRLVDGDRKTSSTADQILRELEDDYKRSDPAAVGCPSENRSPDDSNKENERTAKNASVQTEGDVSPQHKQNIDASQRILKTILGEAPEPKEIVTYPVAITVNVREGSRVVSINGNIADAKILKSGDVVRICDAHESSNWTITSPPTAKADGSACFHLEVAYDHSLIVAQETNTRNDILNRLCYPYKKDAGGAFAHKPTELRYINEGHTRQVACDENEIIHSPLHIKEARIWKVIPRDEDARTEWLREYDNGAIPWDNGNYANQNHATHFRVRIGLDVIEQSCIDSPYPLAKHIHQQRVQFFESVPLTNVIDEAFRNVCRWHPKGTLIDNVKWAKLSRKMKFLSNMKNSNHEIDMAFVRHNQDRRLDLARFHAIFEDIASIQYPSLSKEDALPKVIWTTIVMLPDVNAMMWKVAKQMAIGVEVKRVCAQVRIAALVRKNMKRVEFRQSKQAAVTIAACVRQFLAHLFVSKLLRALRANEEYQFRWRCAVVAQTSWRRFFWRKRFILHQQHRIEGKRNQIAATRALLRKIRERERSLIVFRDVIRVDSTIATVTISFRDDSYLQDSNSMQIKVYVPTTKETFLFNLEEAAIRECLEKALESPSALSWDEMLKENALKQLTKRLMLRVVRGRPIFLFSRRNIVEKGLLVDKRVVRAVEEIFILTLFRSPHDFVFYTYQPSTRLQMKTTLTMSKLREWLQETQQSSGAFGKQAELEDAVRLLDPKRQPELTEWLVKRVVIRKNPRGEDIQLLLQFEAEEERFTNLVTKVQAQWRRLKSFRHAKDKTTHHYEKIFVRENNCYAYRNMQTDERQWGKPKLLGNGDLSEPVDEWRIEESFDPTTGEKGQYYANYATGQSSWLSEEDAARLVQRRYRSKHESDLLGKKMQILDIVKAMKFIHGTRTKHEEDPAKLSNMVNYALLVHCLDLDFGKAKPMYEQALQQSPNHPLIARAYGIFLLASRQTPHATNFQTACRLFQDADIADPSQMKFHSAAEIYFRWAVLVDAKNPLALLNYALLHQCIYRKYDHAEKIYRAALALDHTNVFVVENYHLFTQERYPGGNYLQHGPPYSVVRRSQVIEERPEYAEWSKRTDPECPRKGFHDFWFNRFTKETRFANDEPNWEYVWATRVKRSRIISLKTTNWVEYYDERTQSSFFFSVLTKQYACTAG